MHAISLLVLVSSFPILAEDSDVRMLTDFDEPNVAQAWVTVNDDVMGGRSEGGPVFADGILTFKGSLNTNGGGFSSVRSRPRNWDFETTEGLFFRIRGDGRTYNVVLRTDRKSDDSWVLYRGEFGTKAGQWQEIRVPFDKFEGTYHGRYLGDRVSLDKARTEILGFLIDDGKDGPFQLEVDWIKTY